jgi:prepilin-type processing-associated H-X9-DG protein
VRQQPEANRNRHAQLPQFREFASVGGWSVVDRVVGPYPIASLHGADPDLQRDQFLGHAAFWRHPDAGQQSGQLNSDLYGDQRLQLPLRHRPADRPQRAQQLYGQLGLGPELCIRRQREFDCGPAAGPFIYSSNGVDTGPPAFGGPSINIAAIIDGTSNTAAFSERVKAIGSNFTGTSAPFDGLKPTASLSIPAAVPNSVEGTPQAYYQICSVTPPVPFNGNQDAANFRDDNISGSMWVSGQPACTRYLHVMPPNTWSCRSNLQIAHVANSRHAGGVNVMFCDGSVKFIKSSINVTTWWALGTRAGGEVVSSDQY